MKTSQNDCKKWKPGQLVTIGYKLCRVIKYDAEWIETHEKYFSHLPNPKTQIPKHCYLKVLAWNIKHPTIKKLLTHRKTYSLLIK